MFYLKLLIIPVISALIGWITNKIAVWLLFNPKEPTKFLFWTVQGVFPKRQDAIADRIGDLVADELLSTESIKSQIFTTSNKNGIVNYIVTKIEFYLNTEFKEKHFFLSLLMGEKAKFKFKTQLEEKLHESLEEISTNFHDYLESKVNIRTIVSEKIKGLDSGQVNSLMIKILKSELGFIEITGAILGFIIGLIQVLILEFIG